MDYDYLCCIKVKSALEWDNIAYLLEGEFQKGKILWHIGQLPSEYNPFLHGALNEAYVHFDTFPTGEIKMGWEDLSPTKDVFENYSEIKKIISLYFHQEIDNPQEDDHTGMIYNPITGEYRWF